MKPDRRAELRAGIPSWYSGYVHLLAIHALSLGGIAMCLSALQAPAPWEWLFVPAFFVFANAFEWWVHRGPMHHPTRGMRLVYQRHTLEHHAYFVAGGMGVTGHRELMLVLFPWWFLPAILLLNAPIPLLFAWLGTPNLGWLFYASALAYYLVYEWFHLLHHLPAHSRMARRFRAHHERHHDPALMTRGNFNVSFPLWDALLGTTLPKRGDEHERA